MSLARFFKRGPVDVLRKFLDVRDALPTNMLLEVQPSVELRAIRVWEEFNEQIIRWSMRAVVGAPGAGLNNGLMVCCNGAGNNFTADVPVPVGTIITIDEVANFSAGSVNCAIGASPAGLISALTADFSDARWGNRLGRPPVRAVTGSQGGTTGDTLSSIRANERVQRAGLFIAGADQVAEPLGGDSCLTVWQITANIASDIELQGRVILPR